MKHLDLFSGIGGFALAAQGKMITALHPCRNIQFADSVNSGHIQGTTQGCRCHCQWQTQKDSLAFTLEMFVRFHMEYHIEIAGGTAPAAALALAAQAHA